MALKIELSNEEKAFIAAAVDLLASESKSKIFLKSMIAMGVEALQVDSLVNDIHNMYFISKIEYHPEIETILDHEINTPICPKCSQKLIGDCGRLECRQCDKTYYVENQHTILQCPGCSRYFQNMTAKDKFNGRGSGCSGVKDKGNQLLKK